MMLSNLDSNQFNLYLLIEYGLSWLN